MPAGRSGSRLAGVRQAAGGHPAPRPAAPASRCCCCAAPWRRPRDFPTLSLSLSLTLSLSLSLSIARALALALSPASSRSPARRDVSRTLWHAGQSRPRKRAPGQRPLPGRQPGACPPRPQPTTAARVGGAVSGPGRALEVPILPRFPRPQQHGQSCSSVAEAVADRWPAGPEEAPDSRIYGLPPPLSGPHPPRRRMTARPRAARLCRWRGNPGVVATARWARRVRGRASIPLVCFAMDSDGQCQQNGINERGIPWDGRTGLALVCIAVECRRAVPISQKRDGRATAWALGVWRGSLSPPAWRAGSAWQSQQTPTLCKIFKPRDCITRKNSLAKKSLGKHRFATQVWASTAASPVPREILSILRFFHPHSRISSWAHCWGRISNFILLEFFGESRVTRCEFLRNHLNFGSLLNQNV